MVYINAALNYIADIVGLFLIMHYLDERSVSNSRIIGGVCLALSMFFLYLPHPLKIGSLSTPIRIVLVACINFIVCRKNISVSLYYAIIYTDILNTTRMLFPFMFWFAKLFFYAVPILALSRYTLLLLVPVRLLVLYWISRIIPFKKVNKISMLQWIVVAVLSALIYYSKGLLNSTLQGGSIEFSAIAFPTIIEILSILILVLFDNFLILQDEKRQEALISLSREYQLKSIETRQLANQEVRQLYHDLKNHLLVLEKKSAGTAQEYIDDIWERMDNAICEIDSGNETLSGLLEESMRKAKNSGIEMTIDIDFSEYDSISPVDICAIFGNALDNAFEAAEKVPKELHPFIRIKAIKYSNQMIISISNSCNNNVAAGENGLPVTTKDNPSMHGIGMSSMRSACARCGGSISYKKTSEDVFSLFIMLPNPTHKADTN